MTRKSVLLDTSFFIRFLDTEDILFKNADAFYRYFINNKIDMVISTISIAEYCVIGTIDELPLKNLQILPFNLNHALRTGQYAKKVFENKGSIALKSRNIIPNDSKLFAQADSEASIGYYLSSDLESIKIFNLLKNNFTLNFQFLDLNKTVSESFGTLDF